MKRQASARCRAIIKTKDGKRYLTRWLRYKPDRELGPDEFPAWRKAQKEAQALVARRGLIIDGIDMQFHYPPGQSPWIN